MQLEIWNGADRSWRAATSCVDEQAREGAEASVGIANA